MRFVRFILLCALAMSSAGAQEPGSKLNAEPPLPKSPCRNDGHSFTARVARAPSIEELTRFDLSGLFGHRAYFRTGTLVSVSRREGQWSCAHGAIRGIQRQQLSPHRLDADDAARID